jgi:hypothetical protein
MNKDKSPQQFEAEEDEFPLADQVITNLFTIMETSGVMEHVIKPIQRMDPDRGEDV